MRDRLMVPRNAARPVVNDHKVSTYGAGPGPAWGYHGYEYGDGVEVGPTPRLLRPK